jgi:hypothetical protein
LQFRFVPGIAGAEPSLRSRTGDAFRRLPLGSGGFREVCVTSWSHRLMRRPRVKLPIQSALRPRRSMRPGIGRCRRPSPKLDCSSA